MESPPPPVLAKKRSRTSTIITTSQHLAHYLLTEGDLLTPLNNLATDKPLTEKDTDCPLLPLQLTAKAIAICLAHARPPDARQRYRIARHVLETGEIGLEEYVREGYHPSSIHTGLLLVACKCHKYGPGMVVYSYLHNRGIPEAFLRRSIAVASRYGITRSLWSRPQIGRSYAKGR